MTDKPGTAAGYSTRQAARVRQTCLYLATRLGDFTDDLVVVGGMVPSLLIDQDDLPRGASAHAGTMDLDLGLAVALFEGARYRGLTERLRQSGFEPDRNARGRRVRQRWRSETGEAVTVDFLIQPASPKERGGGIRNIEEDFAAVIAPGLHLAFADRRRVGIAGNTPSGERAARDIWVCGPGAYVVLKSLAFRMRGTGKDAYDLYYVVRNYGSGVEDVADSLKGLMNDPAAHRALQYLREDFLGIDSPGPMRTASFMTGGADPDIQADVAGFTGRLLTACATC
ncbi:MAG: hypothetical protein R6U36_00690 [Candidatus Fermentibacteraceae bacterium]